MTPVVLKKMRRLAKALTAEDLRDLAIACKVQDAASRQLPGLLDAVRVAKLGPDVGPE